jgi:endonuclease/exonuclease/phosphatase family metal-dependent hydrolase
MGGHPTIDRSTDPIPLRVVSWNMNHWRQPSRPIDTRAAGWAYLLHELRADVALLQETVPPRGIDGSVIYREIADYRPWGSAIYARPGLPLEQIWAVATPYSRRRFPLANTFPGSVAVGEVALEGIAPLTFVSVYNVIDVYAQTTLLRTVADLTPLFDSSHGSRVVLAGDLNVGLTTTSEYDLRRGSAILGALKALGLEAATDVAQTRPASIDSCRCGNGGQCHHLPTWNGMELDHAFVSPSLGDQVVGIYHDEEAVRRGLSDHTPLVLDLLLSRQPVARQWDKDTIPAEFERLLGPAARRIVEQLIAWAGDKERAVGEENRKGVRLTRLPGSKSIEPQMWFQIDYQGADLPMYTVSVRGDGRVIVQFQYMLYPPFDTEEGRRPLLDALNAIPDVALDPERLNGRPDFPLALLESPEALDLFIAVLDRIVDDTIPERRMIVPVGDEVDPDVPIGMPG